ncbi:MAG: hypothetical protein AMJ75_08000 [Phycisphaerae bacterium SM1_79]|nr:MAG: hypothetical protein AMJ75_08000 [Phycisphaerae bacterium SM1_79]
MSLRSVLFIALTVLAIVFPSISYSQIADSPDDSVAGIPVNYTEAKVGILNLPDVLKTFDGRPVTDAKTWNEKRRPELLKYIETEYYGRIPATAPKVIWEVVSTDPNALEGKAIMKKLAGHMGSPDGPAIDVTLYTPAGAEEPVPVLTHLTFNFPGFGGRGRRGMRDMNGPPMPGSPAHLISRGYGHAAINYSSIETDREGQPNVNLARKLALAPGQEAPAPDEWGTIAAWAWGISRLMDYYETDPSVDAKRIAITGTSRLGKTVLWAGANDRRIALVIACCGGEGGAALARRNYGETIAHLVTPSRYPYQFAGNYQKFAANPSTSAVDTHCLVALIAPRPILLSTGVRDKWSDPYGEFLAAVAATPAFKLLGKQGIDSNKYSNVGEMVGNELSFLMTNGGHGSADWDLWLKFMDTYLKPRT